MRCTRRDRLALLTGARPGAAGGARPWSGGRSTACISISPMTTGFALACRQGRELGFDGKTLIHPKQIDGRQRGLCADAPRRSRGRGGSSRRMPRRCASGKGVVLVDGKLVENLHVDNARRVLAIAEAIERNAAAPGS